MPGGPGVSEQLLALAGVPGSADVRLAGRFDRAMTMPIEINPDGVKAEYRDGILALFLPRAESDKPKSIEVA